MQLHSTLNNFRVCTQVQRQRSSSGKPCSSCGYKHKYCECKAKGEKCKKCDKVGHFAKVCRSKSVNNSQYRSNNKSAKFSGTRKVHMVTDDGEIQGTVDLNTAMERLKDVISCEFVDTMDVFVDEKPGCAYCPQAKEVPGIHKSEYVSH